MVKSSVRVGRISLVLLRPLAATTGWLPIQTQRRSAVSAGGEDAASACLSQVRATRGGLTACENQRGAGMSNPACSI